MDQDKIGKLIAKLRKEKGLTQRELGEKVGVGFKAVSKWERGITCPDISIINELSKILGITSDELLTGEISNESVVKSKPNHKFNKKILLITSFIIFIGIIIFVVYKINNNNVDVYELAAVSNEYYVEGKVFFDGDDITVYISKLKFIDKDFNNVMVKNYKYRIDYSDKNLLNYGYLLDTNELFELTSVMNITDKFIVNYKNSINGDKQVLVTAGFNLKMTFIDSNNNLIEKNIMLTLNK